MAPQPDYQADVKVPDPGSCNRECKLPVENTPDVPSSGRDEGLHDCALQYDLGPVEANHLGRVIVQQGLASSELPVAASIFPLSKMRTR